MFIGITGTTSSGKHIVAEYLVKKHGFSLLTLENELDTFERDIYNQTISFSNVNDILDYATANWAENYVVCDLECHDLWSLRKRPFFILVSVDAPITLRHERFSNRQAAQGKEIPSLESFILQQDNKLYNNTNMDEGTTLDKTPLTTIMYSSDIHITNTFKTKDAFFQLLDQRNLVNKERLRPSWDTYFMQLSDLAARRSNCMKRRVGCILVKDSKVVATGYNGTPRGLRNCNEGGCERCNQGAPCGTGLDRCLCMHAEENALLEAGRSRVGFDNGVVLYCNTCPCLGCAIKIVQQGVKEVVYNKSYGMDEMTAKIFKEAKVKLRQHSPPSMQIELGSDLEP